MRYVVDKSVEGSADVARASVDNSLDELCRGRTTIVVAHRLSTIKNADEIAVVANGQIVEQGSHQQLLQCDGFYAQLHNSQFAH